MNGNTKMNRITISMGDKTLSNIECEATQASRSKAFIIRQIVKRYFQEREGDISAKDK